MSKENELVIEVTKGEVKYRMSYSESHRSWGVFTYAYDDITCVARFKNILKAKAMMRLLELSE